jgi:hypothetical protein
MPILVIAAYNKAERGNIPIIESFRVGILWLSRHIRRWEEEIARRGKTIPRSGIVAS